MLTPLVKYKKDLKEKKISFDCEQLKVVKELNRLFFDLTKKKSVLIFFEKEKLKKGIYLWGGVGRGKTYLTDMFFECLPFTNKTRLHYYRFMYLIHGYFSKFNGEKNPISLIAKKISKKNKVIVLDEFFVNNIADAMILGRLVQELAEEKVTLVFTSNIHPENLYREGLQRERFLPAIECIKKNMKVINLDGKIDFRLTLLKKEKVYFSPADNKKLKQMLSIFNKLSCGFSVKIDQKIIIEGRLVLSKKISAGIVWFNFYDICDGPRSQNDYIFIAKEFHTVFIEQVPQMNNSDNDRMRRFVSLIDELYDRAVNVVILAEVPKDNLYCGDTLRFEFKRTLSRLEEMQATAYLSQEHKP